MAEGLAKEFQQRESAESRYRRLLGRHGEDLVHREGFRNFLEALAEEAQMAKEAVTAEDRARLAELSCEALAGLTLLAATDDQKQLGWLIDHASVPEVDRPKIVELWQPVRNSASALQQDTL